MSFTPECSTLFSLLVKEIPTCFLKNYSGGEQSAARFSLPIPVDKTESIFSQPSVTNIVAHEGRTNDAAASGGTVRLCTDLGKHSEKASMALHCLSDPKEKLQAAILRNY